MEFRVQKKDALATQLASLDLSADAATKVTARLTFLGRTGFPAGVNTGRGFRGGYSLDQFWQIVLLFHLQRVGIGLTPAIELIRTSWPLASSAIWLSFSRSTKLGLRYYWIIKPAPLQGLDEFEARKEEESQGSIITFGLHDNDPLQTALSAQDAAHVCLIDATSVVDKALKGFRQIGDANLVRDLEDAHRQQQSAATAALRHALRDRS